MSVESLSFCTQLSGNRFFINPTVVSTRGLVNASFHSLLFGISVKATNVDTATTIKAPLNNPNNVPKNLSMKDSPAEDKTLTREFAINSVSYTHLTLPTKA